MRTEAEWRHLHEEAKEAVIPEFSSIWLSATEGDIEQHLGEPDHWPEGVEAEEGVWRDYYTVEKLANYSKPWISERGDTVRNTTDNCLYYKPKMESWIEWQCNVVGGFICPCEYETLPIFNFRGLCPHTLMEHSGYVIRKRTTDLDIVMVGHKSAQIKFKGSQWILTDAHFDLGQRGQTITAKTNAGPMSYALGRNNWTVSGDYHKCSEGKDYTITLKLSACKEDEFTCNDGHCVKMEERCNQMSNCKDESDEIDCKILILKESYNKRVPPVTSVWSGNTAGKQVKTMKKVPVMVSLTLHKIVAIHEEDHSIEFQFQITLQWKESRARYHNLKVDSYFNALSEEEINTIWLPLVIYTNTDQQESTRLGWVNEWSTNVRVERQGNFTRSGFEVLDETEVFKGQENNLTMTQSYTHEFQCIFELERYPFDTQVFKP